VITAEIPYSELVGIISDEFFPAEYSISNGNAAVIPFSNEAAEEYDQISELILDREGPMFLVEADSCIQNISIVCQSLDGGRDDVYKTYYSAYYLNPGSAIMVQVPNEQLNLFFVEYQQDGQTVRIPLETQ